MRREEDTSFQAMRRLREEDEQGPNSSHRGPIDMDARARRRARSEDRPKITMIYCYDRSKIDNQTKQVGNKLPKSNPDLRLRVDQRGRE